MPTLDLTINLDETLQNLAEVLSEAFTKFGVKIIAAILVIVIGFKLVNAATKRIAKGKLYSNLDPTARSFSKSFITIMIKILLIITAAAILGVPMASMVALIGSAGLAIGLALQGSLSNIAGGFIILIFKPFAVGDLISMNELIGTVSGISIFYTKIYTADGKKVVVPNSVISNATLVDISALPTRRIDFEFDTAYASDVDEVKRILLHIAESHELVLKEPAPEAHLGKYKDCSLCFYLRVWCKNDDYFTVLFDINEQVKKAFDENGVSFPFPQLDVHLDR